MVLALRNGLIVESCLPGISSSPRRSATRAALALLQPARPLLRRAG
jgi:hypothetical protein